MSAASRSSSGRRSGGRSERRRFKPAGAAPFLVQNYDSEKSRAKPDNAKDNTYWGGKVARFSKTALILIGRFLPSHPRLFTLSLSRRNFGSNHRRGKCDCEIESYYRSDDLHPSSPPSGLVFIGGYWPRTLFQCVPKCSGPMVLGQQVGECLIGKLL